MAWSDKGKKGESGLHDEGVITITSAKIDFPWPKTPEKSGLVLEGPAEHDGVEWDEHFWLGIGDFEPGDDAGSFAIHTSQKPDKFFNSNSKAMKFIDSALEIPELAEVLESRSRTVEFNGEELVLESRDAKIWEGIKIAYKNVPVTYKGLIDEETGQPVKGTQTVVTEFLGVVEGANA